MILFYIKCDESGEVKISEYDFKRVAEAHLTPERKAKAIKDATNEIDYILGIENDNSRE